jgi:integrase
MGRGTPGSVRWRGRWQTRVRDKASKTARWVDIEAGVPLEQRLRQDQEPLARRLAVMVQEQYRVGGYVPNARDVAVNEHWKIWCDWRRKKYPNQVLSDEAVHRLYVADILGTIPMRAVSRERLIGFSLHLDELVHEGKIGGKRARNVFSAVSAFFRDSFKSKNAKVRVLSSNPCDGVPWPEREAGAPLKQQLFPDEYQALRACPEVPIVRARLWTVMLETTTRVGEARCFDCADFDVAHRMYSVVRAADPKNAGESKLTKSGKSRRGTLEPTLAPVVYAMIVELGGKGRLFPDRPKELPRGNRYTGPNTDFIPGTSMVCQVFRADLRKALAWAGIPERPELFAASDRKRSLEIRSHDLRATGISWRHARGDNPAVIRQECGHENERTNEIYIRALSQLDPTELFPQPPARLLGKGSKRSRRKGAVFSVPTGVPGTLKDPKNPDRFVPKEGLESSSVCAGKASFEPDRGEPDNARCTNRDEPVHSEMDREAELRTLIAKAVVAGDDALAKRLQDVLASTLAEQAQAKAEHAKKVVPLRVVPRRRR